MTRKWNVVNDQSNANYDVGIKLSVINALKPNLCDFDNAYILVKLVTAIIGSQVTQIAFKNCTSMTKYTQKMMEQQ